MQDERQVKAALWRLALGRTSDDSMASAMGTSTILSSSVEDICASAVDEAIDQIDGWAGEVGQNSACLAIAMADPVSERVPPEGQALMSVVESLLCDADVSGEWNRPHKHCVRNAIVPLPRVGTAAEGRFLKELTLIVPATLPEGDLDTFRIAIGGADLISTIGWGRSRSDPQVFGDAMRTRIKALTAEPNAL